MNKIGWEIKTGRSIKEDNYKKKHPVYAAFFYSSKTDINNRDFNNVGFFVPILTDASE